MVTGRKAVLKVTLDSAGISASSPTDLSSSSGSDTLTNGGASQAPVNTALKLLDKFAKAEKGNLAESSSRALKELQAAMEAAKQQWEPNEEEHHDAGRSQSGNLGRRMSKDKEIDR